MFNMFKKKNIDIEKLVMFDIDAPKKTTKRSVSANETSSDDRWSAAYAAASCVHDTTRPVDLDGDGNPWNDGVRW